ncbi:acetyl-coenzyme A synthetase, cytoplasmic-like [Diretmus argenteus]
MVVPGSQHIEDKMYYPPDDLQRDAHVPDFNSYLALYRKSLEKPEAFWKEVADEFFWKKPATGPMLQYNFDVTKGNIYVKCMEGAKTNMCYNVLDRNVGEKNLGERVAYYWEGNSPDHHMVITYRQLLSRVCHCANVLKGMGVKKGDRVSIYLPMIPELVYTMLACARIGAVHSIVFAGFSADSLCERIMDAQSSVLVTAGWYSTVGQCCGTVFEGIPVHPHVGRFWEIIEKYKVTKFYTAPTAIRLLMKYGREPLQKYDLSSLRILGTVGEPINPEAWHWYRDVVGQGRCPVVDTFWQTETGGHVLTPLPAATPLKPGSATFPFFGVEPTILNEHGEELEGEAEGYLVFRRPWPGIMRTVYRNQERFENTYFKKFPGFYVTGDGCRRDKDGYYWITGRIDDMLNVSGHLMSTAEVEAALMQHPAAAEAAVVSRPHAVKGECLYCFVTLKDHREFNRTLVEELKRLVREKIGPIATPDFIQNAPALPKTRSGKIMRRILRQIARNEKDLGDLSTLADPKVVEVLFSQRCEAAA